MSASMNASVVPRTRLSMLELIQDGILTPGEKLLSFDYMGRRCEADLLPDGLIQWDGATFTTPYAWASKCKNLVNPDHKSGIGWGHIRYKGIKLSQYKTVYLRRHRLASSDIQDNLSGPSCPTPPLPEKGAARRKRKKRPEANEVPLPTDTPDASISSGTEVLGNQVLQVANGQQIIVQQQTTSAPSSDQLLKSYQNNAPVLSVTSSSTPNLLQSTPFEALGFQQPFEVRISSNALMMIDFHCHLSFNEVTGYLGGHYHSDTKCLDILQVFPCRCDVGDKEQSAKAEENIQSVITARGLELVGWYHSHPVSSPSPSHDDIIIQKQYQTSLITSQGEEPCVGVIVAPNHGAKSDKEVSEFEMYWVLMIQGEELRASPMKLNFSTQWEQFLTQDIVNEMNALVVYYSQREMPNMRSVWREGVYFITKIKNSLFEVKPRFQGDNYGDSFMTYIDQLLSPK